LTESLRRDLDVHIQTPQMSNFILTDTKLCHGCGICELVCSLSHHGVCGPSFSCINLLRSPLSGEFSLELCKQCQFPACYFSCTVGAIIIEPKTGARIINSDKCVSCGTCYKACPLNDKGKIIRYDPKQGLYFKCDLCSSLDHDPLCVEACPWQALSYIKVTKR